MNLKRKFFSFFLVFFAFFLPSNYAIIVDFNALSPAGGAKNLSTQGFDLSSTGSNGFALLAGGTNGCSPACPFNGTTYLFSFNEVTFNLQSGASFSLASFEGAETNQGQTPGGLTASTIQVIGNLAGGGSVSANFGLDFIHDGEGPQNDFQLFTLPGTFVNLTSVTFEGIGGAGRFTMDNVNFDDIQTPEPSVPEASSVVLLGLSILGMGKYCLGNFYKR